MINLKEGDFAMTAHGSDEEVHIGQVVHVMREGMLGVPGGEYSLEATTENPAVLIQLFEQEESGFWEATNLYTGCMMSLMVAIDPLPQEPELEDMETAMDGAMMYAKSNCCPEDISKQAPCWDGYVQRGMKPGENGKPVPNCVPAEKVLFENFGKDYTKTTRVIKFDDTGEEIGSYKTPNPKPDAKADSYEGCGCETCKALDVSCKNCPVCGPGSDSEMGMAAYDASIGKADEQQQEPTNEQQTKQESFFNFRDMRPSRNTVRLGE